MKTHFEVIRKALTFLYYRAQYIAGPGHVTDQTDGKTFAKAAMLGLEELEKEGERFEVKVGKSFVHKVNGGERPSAYRIVLASKQGDEVTFIGQLEKHNTEAETDTDKELRSRQGGLAREPEDVPFMGLLANEGEKERLRWANLIEEYVKRMTMREQKPQGLVLLKFVRDCMKNNTEF